MSAYNLNPNSVNTILQVLDNSVVKGSQAVAVVAIANSLKNPVQEQIYNLSDELKMVLDQLLAEIKIPGRDAVHIVEAMVALSKPVALKKKSELIKEPKSKGEVEAKADTKPEASGPFSG